MSRLAEMFEIYEERRKRILEEQDEGEPEPIEEEPAEDEPKSSHRSKQDDDFGEDPDGGAFFDSEEEDDEFRGAPADPSMSDGDGDGFSDGPGDDYGECQFGEVPEPSTEPDDALWHSNVGWNDEDTGTPSGKHRTDVRFAEREDDEEGE